MLADRGRQHAEVDPLHVDERGAPFTGHVWQLGIATPHLDDFDSHRSISMSLIPDLPR